MEENNSPVPSPTPGDDTNMGDDNPKTCETLKSDIVDGVSFENTFSDINSDVLINEASKICQIGIEKDMIIWQKNKILQDAAETMETMKNNIYHIQLEYEKLDQNYQKEVANSTEAIKRMDITRGMIESAVHYSNILATSIKQLEEDKFKIVEFYNEIQIRQEEDEEKLKKIEVILNEQVDFTKKFVSQLIAEKEKTEENLKMLSDNLYQIENRLKCETDAKVELELKLERYKDEVTDVKTNLNMEQTNRIKYQVIQSHLKRRLLHQKHEDEKSLNSQKILYTKKIKKFKSKVKYLQERLDSSEEHIANYLRTIKDLEIKVIFLNENLQKESGDHEKEVEELEGKLRACLAEKDNFDDFIRILEQKNLDENKNIEALKEENVRLLSLQEAINFKLEEKENQANILLEENTNLHKQIQELSLEINNKIQQIKDFEVELLSHNTEDLMERIRIYEEKFKKRDEIENDLRDEIALLKETLSKECCENENVILEHRERIRQLEKEVLEFQEQKEAAERKLNDNYTEYTHVKDQLTLKTADLERITHEFESKMKMVSNDAELSDEYKRNLEKEKQLNEELLLKLQNLEEEKIEMDRNLTKALEREDFLSKTLEIEREDAKTKIRKLYEDIQLKEELLKAEEDKLNGSENEIFEMEKLSKKLKACETCVKKSLQCSQTYMKKLEGETAKGKHDENETVKKRSQSEISQLRQMKEKNDNFNTVLETPKRRNSGGVGYQATQSEFIACINNNNTNKNNHINEIKVFKDGGENIGSASKNTPSSSRRLLRSPNRLLGSPHPSPNFKSLMQEMKNPDPYEYDSDGSMETLNPRKVLKNSQTVRKKNIFQSKRKQ